MKWKHGLALLLVIAATGCGNAANNTGNAAGMAGNAVGNVVRGTGNVVGNAAGWTGGVVGNTVRGTGNAVNNVANGPDYHGGTQAVQFHSGARTVDIRLAGTAARSNARGGTIAGDIRGADVAGNIGSAPTITVPTGWKVRLTVPNGAAWANNVSIAPYRGNGLAGGGGTFAGTAGARTATGAPAAGSAAARNAVGGARLSNGHAFTLTKPGLYAIVVNGNGIGNRVVDFVNVTSQNTSPSIVSTHSW